MSSLFRFATAGSVDDGKSTLVGRLLHDAKAILAKYSRVDQGMQPISQLLNG